VIFPLGVLIETGAVNLTNPGSDATAVVVEAVGIGDAAVTDSGAGDGFGVGTILTDFGELGLDSATAAERRAVSRNRGAEPLQH